MEIKLDGFKYNKNSIKPISKIIKETSFKNYYWSNKLSEDFCKVFKVKYSFLFPSSSIALLSIIRAINSLNEKELNFNRMGIITSPLIPKDRIKTILLSRQTPLFCDIFHKTFCMDTELLKEKVKRNSDKLLAIYAHHTFGNYCDIEYFKHDPGNISIYTIEDCSESILSFNYDNNPKLLGTIGDVGIFSFESLGVDLSIIILNSDSLFDSIFKTTTISLDQGQLFSGLDPGAFNEINSCLAYFQIGELENIIKKRKENFKWLNRKLEKFSKYFIPPIFYPNSFPKVYPLICKLGELNKRKKLEKHQILETFNNQGIRVKSMVNIDYLYPNFSSELEDCPIADSISKAGFLLPCHEQLEEKDLKKIVGVFENIFKNSK